MINNKELINILNLLLRLPIWSPRQGVGSFLSFELGQPHQIIREPVSKPTAHILLKKRKVTIVGDYHFWIQNADWKVFNAGNLICGNESTNEDFSKAITFIDGQSIISFDINDDENNIVLNLDLMGAIEIRLNELLDNDQFSITQFGRQIITVMSDGSESTERI